jgi:hypothetical protein
MFASLQELIQHFENPSGDPTALNYRYDATHTASGLYQITNTTWGGFGGYSSAAAAPPEVQTTRFQQLVGQRGLADWTCPGCNPALSTYLAANPDAANLPVIAPNTSASSGASSGAGSAGSGGFLDWLLNPPALTPEDYAGGTNVMPDPHGTLGGASSQKPEGGGAAIVNGANSVAGAAGGWIDQLTGWIASVSTRVGIFVLALVFIIGALILFGLKSGIEMESGGGN